MNSKLNLIAKQAEQDKKRKFTSLIHHINEDNLLQCYSELKRNRACGIDGVTLESYGEHLEENIKCLVERLKSKTYRPKPVKRVYIPKAGKGEMRGLGIPSLEDKLVQLMVKKLLENIYEADFLDCSYGFRPRKSCHDAINDVDKTVMTKPINYVVEVDIRKFFDRVSHYWLLRCLEERVSDPNMLWLVRRFLKSGIVESGQYIGSNLGAPQGGIASPLLANIYLHYVLDLWFEKIFKSTARGYVKLIRYCDDFVVCCENKRDAEEFLIKLKDRLAKFNLEIAEDKTGIVKFGRQAWKRWRRGGEKPGSFTFLGFTHYCSTSRRGKFIMGHKTSKDNLRRKLRDTRDWLKKVRNQVKLKEWWEILKLKLSGHYRYFGISGNFHCLDQFYRQILSMAFKWINRRSQKKSMNWTRFLNYLELNPLPRPQIYHNLYTLSPGGKCLIEEPRVGKPQAWFCGGYHSDETYYK